MEYLDSFKNRVNIHSNAKEKITNIELFSGIKAASYYVPNIMDYLNYPPYSNRGSAISQPAWFVEIWIDHLCVWRKSKLNETGENLQQYEDELLKETLKGIVLSGLHSSWRTIKDLPRYKYSNGAI